MEQHRQQHVANSSETPTELPRPRTAGGGPFPACLGMSGASFNFDLTRPWARRRGGAGPRCARGCVQDASGGFSAGSERPSPVGPATAGRPLGVLSAGPAKLDSLVRACHWWASGYDEEVKAAAQAGSGKRTRNRNALKQHPPLEVALAFAGSPLECASARVASGSAPRCAVRTPRARAYQWAQAAVSRLAFAVPFSTLRVRAAKRSVCRTHVYDGSPPQRARIARARSSVRTSGRGLRSTWGAPRCTPEPY
jgi:hypothetical protein